ncbi:MAG TPA: hypothetical protein VH436_00775 [Vicinamibacterales bacterium]
MPVALAALAAALVLSAPTGRLEAQASSAAIENFAAGGTEALEAARLEYYNARYQPAAALTLRPCTTDVNGVGACELHTAALLLQIRNALGPSAGKASAWKDCLDCPALLSAFKVALARGQALARGRLEKQPLDDETRFLLGKLDLNYVWLQLGTLGHKTGWDEYWEGRRALDQVLVRQPGHVRARVARGWVDYIVDTRMPRGTRWLLGGGNKKKGLLAIREAAAAESDFFTRAEARFALWDTQVRERDAAGALTTAGLLIRDFPENPELRKFIDARRSVESSADATQQRRNPGPKRRH